MNLTCITTINTVTKQVICSDILQSNLRVRPKNTIWNSILYAIVRYKPIKPVYAC